MKKNEKKIKKLDLEILELESRLTPGGPDPVDICPWKVANDGAEC